VAAEHSVNETLEAVQACHPALHDASGAQATTDTFEAQVAHKAAALVAARQALAQEQAAERMTRLSDAQQQCQQAFSDALEQQQLLQAGECAAQLNAALAEVGQGAKQTIMTFTFAC
jgi:hypothetical protein